MKNSEAYPVSGGKESSFAKGEIVLEVQGLEKSFGTNCVLTQVNLNLCKGENLVVLGKSGSGKSVLIKCIIGLMKPDKGSIRIFGTDISTLNHRELDEMRMRVGFLFQSNALYDSMSVRENLEFPLRRHRLKLSAQEVNERVLEALSNVGLTHTVDMMPEELSGGMRKRIALARTLILKPEIILYDEPTTGLDPVTAKEISFLMLEIQKKYNTSSVIISHDVHCVEIVANRVMLLWNKTCYASASVKDLRQSEDPVIHQFFN